MNILLLFPGFIIAFVIVLCYERKIKNLSVKPKNNVHFYVARDKYDNVLCLYLGKPVRGVGTFHSCDEGCTIEVGNYFSHFGLNPDDFKDLKWEDEPIEVFINMKD